MAQVSLHRPTRISPRNSILVWLAGLVIGVGVGVVVVYHLLHGDRAEPPVPIAAAPNADSGDKRTDMGAAHAAALAAAARGERR